MPRLYGLLIGLAVAGIALIVCGATGGFPFLTSIGGGLFGACLGSFIGRLAKQDLALDIKNTVRQACFPGFTSDEDKISSFRMEWHLYHVTEMERQMVWRHAVLHLGKTCIPGRLIPETCLPDKRGVTTAYDVEGGMRDERLVLFLKGRRSEEPCGVYVFPFVGLRFEDQHPGVLCHQTWDSTHSISPALISRDAIPGAMEEGTLPESASEQLDKLWLQSVVHVKVLPRVTREDAFKLATA